MNDAHTPDPRDGNARSVRPAWRETRTLIAVLAAAAIGASGIAVVTAVLPRLDLGPACGPGADMVVVGGITACAHADVPPPGVDIDEPVTTAELHEREGVGANAVAVAEELGVAATPAVAVSSPEVTCDGDGQSGYRTQAMYVVEAGTPNRYDQVKGDIQTWAAGVDDVFNRSAALTGGVRHVRYVTEAAGTGCVARVVNVTVPVGSMTTFNATMNAVRALGYDRPERKYLMWTDAYGKGICGIALRYTSDADSQGNPNNGLYPQYARIDSPCWGHGDGTNQSSIEAHELMHTLGGVSPAAPHGTSQSHCWDESDTMCYADGGGKVMQQVCDRSREYLLDCNFDDYYSTFPDPGSWLDTHWNSADSRFLVGGGDNAEPGRPTVLGAVLGVNNPAVPGLATQASVTPVLPDGRTLASVAWRAGRSDCTFSAPTAVQTDVTCNASNATGTNVTATLVDSTGATKVVTSPLTFSTAARTVGVRSVVAGQDSTTSPTASACASAPTPVQAYFYDLASDQPIKGLTATIVRTTGITRTTLAAISDLTGYATASASMSAPTSFSTTNKALPAWPAAAPVTQAATVAKCAVQLTAALDTTTRWYGQTATVTGRATRVVSGATLGVAGVTVPVTLTSTSVVSGRSVTTVASLGSVRTSPDGSFSLVTRPTTSGVVKASVPASVSYEATAVEAGNITVRVPTSALSASIDKTSVAYGQTVKVTGRLLTDTGTPTPVAAATVAVKVAAPGKAAVVVASGRTSADGSFTIPVLLRLSGDLTVSYAGSAGVPAASAAVAPVTAGSWTTRLTTPVASPATAPARTARTLTGLVTRTFGGTTEPARSVRLTVAVQPLGGTATTTTVTTTTTGAYTLRVSPAVATTYTVRVLGVAGHLDVSATPVTMRVG